jgi:hypothetical protein
LQGPEKTSHEYDEGKPEYDSVEQPMLSVLVELYALLDFRHRNALKTYESYPNILDSGARNRESGMKISTPRGNLVAQS